MNERKSTEFTMIPSVPGAIVYDFRGRTDIYYPDAALGREAWESATPNQVWIGARGAGSNVSVGKILGGDRAEPSGQGASFLQIGEIKIFVLSVVNAAGCILNRKGEAVAGHFDALTNSRASASEELIRSSSLRTVDERGNTTISVLFTNAKIDRIQLHRLCATTHMGLGRVIEPYATGSDGDVFFAFTTGEVERPANLSLAALGALGARVAQDAVLSAIEAVRS
jgi:L-aminopeptidase/D-esterase-like protein